jgi:uncharacterized membrane protein
MYKILYIMSNILYIAPIDHPWGIPPMNDWTLHEKSALGTLLGVAAFAWFYFTEALALQRAGVTEASAILGPVIGAVIVLIVIQVIYHAVATRAGDDEALDERDRAVRLRAEQFASLALSVGVVGVVATLVFSAPGRGAFSPLLVVNLLVAVLLASEAVEQVATLALYRAGP